MAMPTTPRSRVETALIAEKLASVSVDIAKQPMHALGEHQGFPSLRPYALTTRMPENDSVSRPEISALILERSRKSGRSVRKA